MIIAGDAEHVGPAGCCRGEINLLHVMHPGSLENISTVRDNTTKPLANTPR